MKDSKQLWKRRIPTDNGAVNNFEQIMALSFRKANDNGGKLSCQWKFQREILLMVTELSDKSSQKLKEDEIKWNDERIAVVKQLWANDGTYDRTADEMK